MSRREGEEERVKVSKEKEAACCYGGSEHLHRRKQEWKYIAAGQDGRPTPAHQPVPIPLKTMSRDYTHHHPRSHSILSQLVLRREKESERRSQCDTEVK